jgi:hypothetical protein
MNPFAMTMMDIWTWLKWQAIWFVQRLTRYLMPHSGLKAGFRFGDIQVWEVDWYEWGDRLLVPRIVYSDGKKRRDVHFEQFGWLSWEKFLLNCAENDVRLPENCVWVVKEKEL